MSFSYKDIKRDTKTPSEKIVELYKLVYSYDCLTSEVKEALLYYIRFRVAWRFFHRLSSGKFRIMIEDLLEYCIDKNIEFITLQDVINNERRIITEIGKAVYGGNMHNLYLEDDFQEKIIKQIQTKQVELEFKGEINKDNVNAYFKRLMK